MRSHLEHEVPHIMNTWFTFTFAQSYVLGDILIDMYVITYLSFLCMNNNIGIEATMHLLFIYHKYINVSSKCYIYCNVLNQVNLD